MHAGRHDRVEAAVGRGEVARRVEPGVDGHGAAHVGRQRGGDGRRLDGVVRPVLGDALARREERDLHAELTDEPGDAGRDRAPEGRDRRIVRAGAGRPAAHGHRDPPRRPARGPDLPRRAAAEDGVRDDVQPLRRHAELQQVRPRALVAQEHERRAREDPPQRVALRHLPERAERLGVERHGDAERRRDAVLEDARAERVLADQVRAARAHHRVDPGQVRQPGPLARPQERGGERARRAPPPQPGRGDEALLVEAAQGAAEAARAPGPRGQLGDLPVPAQRGVVARRDVRMGVVELDRGPGRGRRDGVDDGKRDRGVPAVQRDRVGDGHARHAGPRPSRTRSGTRPARGARRVTLRLSMTRSCQVSANARRTTSA